MTATPSGVGLLHEHVAAQIRSDIRSRRLEPGSRLDPERDLMVKYKVSRNTVRSAIAQLVGEGLLISGQGRGTYVREDDLLCWHLSDIEGPQRADDPDTGLDAWAVDIAAQGRKPSQDVDVDIVRAGDEIGEYLSVDPDDFVVVRRRLRYIDGLPSMLADSYFPESLARGTPLMETGDRVERGGILAAIGRPQATWEERIRVRMPTPEETDRLRIPPGTPVARLTRIGWDANGVAIRVMISLVPGNRHELVYRGETKR